MKSLDLALCFERLIRFGEERLQKVSNIFLGYFYYLVPLSLKCLHMDENFYCQIRELLDINLSGYQWNRKPIKVFLVSNAKKHDKK